MGKKLAFVLVLCIALAMGSLAACGGGKKNSLTWSGLDDVEIAAGDKFDVKAGVTVKKGNKDLTSEMVVLTEAENEEELTDLGVWEDYRDFDHNIVGVYDVYYMVKDGDKKVIEKREITVTQKHNIANGDFTITNPEGWMGWKFDTPSPGASIVKDDNNKPYITLPSTGNAWYGAQLMSQCNLVQGETYKITLRAKSETSKSIAFGFEDVANNYAMLQGVTAHKLTNQFADYVSYYTANKTYVNAKAVFYLGHMLESDSGEHTLTIDSVYIEKIARCPEVTFTGLDALSLDSNSTENFDPLAGVTAKQGETDLTSKIKVCGTVAKSVFENTNFALAYVVENENGPTAVAIRTVTVKVVRTAEYALNNGNFDENIEFWTQDVNADEPPAGGRADFEWVKGDDEEGAVKVTVTEVGDAAWRIQLRQDVNMAANTNFTIKIRAKASMERTMAIELNAASNSMSTLNLTTEYQDLEFDYVSTSKTTGFRLFFGGGGPEYKNSWVMIDSVEIALDPDQTQYEPWQMLDPTFKKGMKKWGSEGATFTATTDGEDTAVTATLANQTDGAGWRIQLRQDGKTFIKGQKYKIIVRAKCSVARQITVEVTGDVGKSTQFDLTTEAQDFEFEFTPDKEDHADEFTGTRVGMLLGGSDIAGQVVTIYSFEIVKVDA